ncbi:hypothetical protein [Oceanobacillus sp. J11TS1]|uniref:hypothetical protein n=1 Tax=Oceanobacillus sp. J11TS1 TaxID=2807191 RepID=UPI001B0068C6|nr:hypothetical protein [Oceanobacillus sp. J11TS1]GIO23532.1 hypothetical protein J11TS1_21130 [Oceanobacillus sp. J11TS1]
MKNKYLMIALMIIILPVTQLSSDINHSYALPSQDILIDNHGSPDLSSGGNDHPEKPFTHNLFLVITLFLIGSTCLFTTIVMIVRNKQLLAPVFYQSNFVV